MKSVKLQDRHLNINCLVLFLPVTEENWCWTERTAGLRIDETPTAVTPADGKHRKTSVLYKSEHVDVPLSLFSVLTVFYVFVCLWGLLTCVILCGETCCLPLGSSAQHSGRLDTQHSRGAVDKNGEGGAVRGRTLEPYEALGNMRFIRRQNNQLWNCSAHKKTAQVKGVSLILAKIYCILHLLCSILFKVTVRWFSVTKWRHIGTSYQQAWIIWLYQTNCN